MTKMVMYVGGGGIEDLEGVRRSRYSLGDTEGNTEIRKLHGHELRAPITQTC